MTMIATPTKKAAGGFKTTTATTSHNAIDFIATCARQESIGDTFHAKSYAGMGRQRCRAPRGCATLIAGARHTTKQAGNLSDNEVFSRSEFMVSGLGVPIRKDGSMACFMCLYPAPPFGLDSQTAGFSVQQGTEIMTTTTTTTTPALGNPSPLTRQQAIENALSMALFHIRHSDGIKGIHAATAKAIRAASMLKQACAEFAAALTVGA